ncbi:hypothetical protein L7F22_058741 [Adiantum nelumboides]|nr:hypothetical protein [Adiantum nelumboides]
MMRVGPAGYCISQVDAAGTLAELSAVSMGFGLDAMLDAGISGSIAAAGAFAEGNGLYSAVCADVGTDAMSETTRVNGGPAAAVALAESHGMRSSAACMGVETDGMLDATAVTGGSAAVDRAFAERHGPRSAACVGMGMHGAAMFEAGGTAASSRLLYTPRELAYLAAALQRPLLSKPTTRGRLSGRVTRPTATAGVSPLSVEPQSVTARQRRARIRDKLNTLQELVPGGAALDTASLLQEAVHYIAFLQVEVAALCHGSSRLLHLFLDL